MSDVPEQIEPARTREEVDVEICFNLGKAMPGGVCFNLYSAFRDCHNKGMSNADFCKQLREMERIISECGGNAI